MDIELVTGRAREDHISANDYRAINRANYGQGRYILKDQQNMKVIASPVLGSVSIETGSCLWSGMHIRNKSLLSLNYAVPTTTQTVYIYAHYIKDDEGYESVDFGVSMGQAPDLIVDNLSDNTVEAYTIFATFEHNPLNNEAKNLKYDFMLIDSHEDFDLETIYANMQTIAAETSTASANSALSQAKAYTDEKIVGAKKLWGTTTKLDVDREIECNEKITNFLFLVVDLKTGDNYSKKAQAIYYVDALQGGTSGRNYAAIGNSTETKVLELISHIDDKTLTFKAINDNYSVLAIYGVLRKGGA